MSQDETDLVYARARRLSSLLRDADPPVPAITFPAERIARATRHRSVVRWRAAAAIVLVAAGAVGVKPVRAWIAQAARTVWTAAAGRRTSRSAEPAPPAGAGAVTFVPAAGSFTVRVAHRQAGGTLTIETTVGAAATAGTVTFKPAAGSFVIRVVRPQVGGTLTIETTPGEAASAALTGGRGEAELVVLPDGLRIVNDSLSSTNFVVKVPRRMARIEVGIAGRTTRVLVPPASGAVTRWVVDLGAVR